MRNLILLAVAGTLYATDALVAQAPFAGTLREWPVEWGGRVRDPFVAPDGKVWFVGQQGNYVGSFDPISGAFRRYAIEEGTNPHTVVVSEDGAAWYAGNRNGRIGRLDPVSGEAKVFLTGDARDPHTMAFDRAGRLWFTSQGSNRVGRLDPASGEVVTIVAHDQPSNPYGMVIDGEGRPLVSLLRTNTIIRIDPETLEITRFEQGDPAARSRRVEWTPSGHVWYADEARGFLGRIDPSTGAVKEWAVPGGPGSRPYALTKDDQGRLWFSESGPTKRLVGFDPGSETFFASHPVSGTIRNMMFDAERGALWFGTDANQIGRLLTRAGEG